MLLINLGTPRSTSIKNIRRYLREFLSDWRVLSIPSVARWLLLHTVILPFRPSIIQKNYQRVWTKNGSPLDYYTRKTAEGIAARLDKRYLVRYAMRYQEPSFTEALNSYKVQGITRLLLVPLFPQYAMATTGSVYARTFDLLSNQHHIPCISFLGDFFDAQFFIKAQAEIAKPYLNKGYDHVLFTYHGLPKKHLTHFVDGQLNNCYQRADCCASLNADNAFCYRAQCIATSRALASELGLTDDCYSTSFQSRFGPAEWIQPYTTERLKTLATTHKRLVVICPAFTADCIETLDEIGREEKENFLAAGGKVLHLVPCVNDNPIWIAGLADAIMRRTAEW